MIYIYHNLLNKSTSGIITWCKLFKLNTNIDSLLVDDLNNINFSSTDKLIINHLDIIQLKNHTFVNNKPRVYIVIHNLDSVFIKIFNENNYLIDFVISIFPIDIILNANLVFQNEIIYLPNINLNIPNIIYSTPNFFSNNCKFNNTFYYYGRLDYEKNVILLIDLMQHYYTDFTLTIIYPQNTSKHILNFYYNYLLFCKLTNVLMIDDITYKSTNFTNKNNNDLIYLSAGTMEGLPYTYLELLSNDKIVISYNSGIVNNLLTDEFIVDYKNTNNFVKNNTNNIIHPLIATRSFKMLDNYMIYKKFFNGLPIVQQHLLLPTYITNNHVQNIYKMEYLQHLTLWIDKINSILQNLEHNKKKSNECYIKWYEHAKIHWHNFNQNLQTHT